MWRWLGTKIFVVTILYVLKRNFTGEHPSTYLYQKYDLMCQWVHIAEPFITLLRPQHVAN